MKKYQHIFIFNIFLLVKCVESYSSYNTVIDTRYSKGKMTIFYDVTNVERSQLQRHKRKLKIKLAVVIVALPLI